MSLLAEFAAIFFPTAILAFLLGHWWARQGVSEVDSATLRRSLESIHDGINGRIDQLEALLKNLPTSKQYEPVDLETVRQTLAELDSNMRDFPAPAGREAVGLDSIGVRVDRISKILRELDIPAVPELQPVNDRLRVIESKLVQLATGPQSENLKLTLARSSGPPLADSDALREKDDLEQIVGIGPKLRDTLNENGIYYFWQIAEWSAADTQVVNELLGIFPGQIDNDDWVGQAKALIKNSPAASAGRSVPFDVNPSDSV